MPKVRPYSCSLISQRLTVLCKTQKNAYQQLQFYCLASFYLLDDVPQKICITHTHKNRILKQPISIDIFFSFAKGNVHHNTIGMEPPQALQFFPKPSESNHKFQV